MDTLSKLTKALDRRNRQAAKVSALVDRLYEAREVLRTLDGEVDKAHRAAPEGTLISFGSAEWTVSR